MRLRANSTAMKFLKFSPFSYEPVKQEDSSEDDRVRVHKDFWSTVRPYTSDRRFRGTAVLLALLILLSLLFSSSRNHGPAYSHRDQALYFLLPTSRPDLGVCRTMLTAGIAGYPTPYLVTWDQALDAPGKSSERDHSRIGTILEYLSRRPHRADEDLVLILNGQNTWFQLRPETLLKRYYSINRRANDRLQKSLGRRTIWRGSIKQTVIFSAQDSCTGHTPDDAACYAVPESPLSNAATRDLRYGSTSTILGPVNQVRAIFQRASDKAQGRGQVNFQAIFEEILGEQEFKREVERQKDLSMIQRTRHSFIKIFGFGKRITDAVPGRKLMQEEANVQYEYGIGLDYANELSITLPQSQKHVVWHKHGVGGSSSQLPKDISTSMRPYWTPTGYGVPSNQSWEETLLLVDERTNSIPPMINFEWYEPKEDVSLLQEREWKKIWQQPYAHKLYEEAMTIPRVPLVSVVDDSGVEHTFWDHETRLDRAGAKTISGVWQSWLSTCGSAETWKHLKGVSAGRPAARA